MQKEKQSTSLPTSRVPARNAHAVVLHNIRSAHNVGSVFRTADAAGIREIFLVGYTPLPVNRFGHVQKEIAKTALGGEKTVPWTFVSTWRQCEKLLKERGYRLVAVEQDKRALPYTALHTKSSKAFIFGNEVQGLPKAVRDSADALVYIPMRGKKESLNVSVAAGIIMYSFL